MVTLRPDRLASLLPLSWALALGACLGGDASYADDDGTTASSVASSGSTTGGGAPATSTSTTTTTTSGSSAGGSEGGGAPSSTSESSTSTSGGGGRGQGGGGAGGNGTGASGQGGDGSGGGPVSHVLTLGGTGAEEVFDARFAADGSAYVAGAFRGGPNIFGATVLGPDCHGTRRGYLLRLNASLEPEWVRCFGADSSEIVSMVFDGAGKVFALGRFSGDMEVAGQSLSRAELTLFVASLDADGADRWVKQYPAPDATRANGIARTPDALFITGSFRGEITLGGVLLQGDAQYDGFMARISDTDGGVDWALHQVESANGVNLYAGSSPAGDSPLLLAGEYNGDLTLVEPGGTERTVTDVDGPAAGDMYVAEIDPDDGGVVGPIQRFGGPADEHVTGFDVGDDVAVLSATFHGTLDPDGDAGPLPACTATDGDAFVVRMDAANRQALSALCAGGAGDQIPRSVAITRDGLRTAVGGDFVEEIDWGAGSATTTIGADGDAFAFATDDGLAVTLGEAFGGGTGVRSVRGVDAQNSGRFLFAGTFADTILLPDGMHDSAGSTDVFVLLYDALP